MLTRQFIAMGKYHRLVFLGSCLTCFDGVANAIFMSLISKNENSNYTFICTTNACTLQSISNVKYSLYDQRADTNMLFYRHAKVTYL